MLAAALQDAAKSARVPVTINRLGSMMTMFFTNKCVTDYDSALGSDTEAFGRFHQAMAQAGVYLPPSQFECMFVSTAHTDEHVERTAEAAAEAFKQAAG